MSNLTKSEIEFAQKLKQASQILKRLETQQDKQLQTEWLKIELKVRRAVLGL